MLKRLIGRQRLAQNGGNGLLPCRQSLLKFSQQGRARRGKSPHFFWNAQIADADLPEHGLHVGAEAVGELLRQIESVAPLRLQPVKHGKKVKRQHEKASLEPIGHPKLLVENGKPRLRHNRAIEFYAAGLVAAPLCEARERVQRTARLV